MVAYLIYTLHSLIWDDNDIPSGIMNLCPYAYKRKHDVLYAYTTHKYFAEEFMEQRCKDNFKAEKRHISKKKFEAKFPEKYSLTEIFLSDGHGNDYTIVGTTEENLMFDTIFDTTIDYTCMIKSAARTSKAFTDDIYPIIDLLTTVKMQDQIVTNVDTFHLFYEVFERTFVSDEVWDKLGAIPASSFSSYKEIIMERVGSYITSMY